LTVRGAIADASNYGFQTDIYVQAVKGLRDDF